MTTYLRHFSWVIWTLASCLLSTPLTAQVLVASAQVPSRTVAAQASRRALKDVLLEFERRYHVSFVCRGDLLENKMVDGAVLAQPGKLERQLSRVLRPLRLSYRKVETDVYLIQPLKESEASVNDETKSGAGPTSSLTPSLPSLSTPLGQLRLPANPAATSAGVAQPNIIKGRVLDGSNNQPLPGATILLLGTTRGTTANTEGEFDLNVPDLEAVLKISFLGYKAITRKIAGSTNFTVTLSPDNNALEEVTVLAYGEQVRRRDLSGAIASVKARDIENVPLTSLEQLLQGRAAGVQVIANSGAPGSGITVRIRGTTSISADNQPLWVVDGVPIRNENIVGSLAAGSTNSPISDLNPADIESIEVLKDASTAAIYGARAANGVVLVTTKRGKTGKAQLDFSAQGGVSIAPPKLPLLNAVQSKAYIAERNFHTGNNDRENANNPNSDQRFQYGFYPDSIRSTDWQDLVRQNGPFQNYNLSLKGGTANSVLYSIGGGHLDEQGTIINSRYRRTNVRANLDFYPFKRLQVGSSFNLAYSANNRIDRGTFFTDPLELALRKLPDLQVYDVSPVDGVPAQRYASWDLYDRNNPVAVAELMTNVAKQFRGYGNVYAQYQIIPNQLTLRAQYGIDYTNGSERRFFPKDGFRNSNRQIQQQNYGNLTWFQDIYANYFKTLGQHTVQGLLAYSAQKSTNTVLSLEGQGGITDADEGQYVTSAPRISGWNAYEVPNGLSSISAKGTYTFDKLLSVSGLIKRETSTRFSLENRVGYFPAVSGFFRFSQLPLFSRLQAYVSDLKLRASWGVTGNQNGIADYEWLTRYASGYNYIGTAGVTASNIRNTELKWETTHTTNVGLDVGLLNGRFYLSADYYVKNTKDLLLPFLLPTTSGFASVLRNVGSTRNQGLELAVQGDVLRTKHFRWNINYNVASNTNRLISSSTGDDLRQLSREGFLGIGQVGEPVGTWYGLEAQGVLARDEDSYLTQIGQTAEGRPLYEALYLHPGAEVARDASGSPLRLRSGYTNRDFTGGDMLYRDTNRDGVISEQDFVVIGRAQPKLYGGLSNTFSYKGLAIDLFFQYSLGNDVVNATRQLLESGGPNDNALVSMTRSWRTQGDITDIPRLGDRTRDGKGSGINDFKNSSRWIEDGSYMRLKAVTVSYNFPKRLAIRVGAANLRVFASGANLLTFTRYKGYDPEFNNSTNVLLLGYDYVNYPLPRRFTGGISLTY